MVLRIFLTCWLVYTLHFASNIVREIYPALSIGDHFSFRADEYAHLLSCSWMVRMVTAGDSASTQNGRRPAAPRALGICRCSAAQP